MVNEPFGMQITYLNFSISLGTERDNLLLIQFSTTKSWGFSINCVMMLQRNLSVNTICGNMSVQAAATKFLRSRCTKTQGTAEKSTFQP